MDANKSSAEMLAADVSSDYPAFDNTRLLQPGEVMGQFDATNQPNWLPAAIILPLAAAIALTIAVVCMLTRASRLFRGRKTVLVTDRAMLSNLHSVNNLAYVGVGPEHQLQQGTLNGGKSNPAFDGSTSAVDREGLSKL